MHLLWDSSRKSPEHSVERKATLSIWIRSFTSWPDASGRGENLIYRTGRSEIWAKFCISLIQWSLGNGLLCVCVRVLQVTLESPTSFLALKKSLSIYQSEHRASRISSKWDDRVCVCLFDLAQRSGKQSDHREKTSPNPPMALLRGLLCSANYKCQWFPTDSGGSGVFKCVGAENKCQLQAPSFLQAVCQLSPAWISNPLAISRHCGFGKAWQNICNTAGLHTSLPER